MINLKKSLMKVVGLVGGNAAWDFIKSAFGLVIGNGALQWLWKKITGISINERVSDVLWTTTIWLVILLVFRWLYTSRQRKEMNRHESDRADALQMLTKRKDEYFEAHITNWLVSESKEIGGNYYDLALKNDKHPSLTFPLASHAWPHMGDKWDSVHVNLNCLWRRLTRYLALADAMTRKLGWSVNEERIFKVNDSTRMPELLDAFKDWEVFLANRGTPRHP